MPGRPPRRRRARLRPGAALGATGAALALAVAGTALSDELAIRKGAEVRRQGLAAAAAWADAITAHRAPRLPDPGATETLIVILDDPAAADAPPGAQGDYARRNAARQSALEPGIAALGGVVLAHWRVVLNGMAVQVPTGRADAVATLDGVRSVAPVTYLAPAARSVQIPAGIARTAPTPPRPAAGGPAHIALVDTGINPRTPQLGGGIGPTFPIIGGADLVDGDADPTVGDTAPSWEAHGTQMAGLVVGAAALDGLEPARVPRLLAYRVVAEEAVGGVRVPLARSDRVISALEKAVDPDGDGDPRDGAQVTLLGLAGAFAGAGRDPVDLAVAGASAAGSLVVVPAGNDGPTYARMGSTGAPADSAGVLTVGGLTESRAARTAELAVHVGPAAALLSPLPLLGPEPAATRAPLVVLPGADGPGPGVDPAEYARAAATGLPLRGALVVVTRGGGSIPDKARVAAAAGAAGIVVWDRTGTGVFPAGASGGGPLVPVLGAGPAQGQALVDLLGREPSADASVRALARPADAATVASFSSTGPTADGRIKPDLVAPAVDVTAPWPPGPDGTPRVAGMTGTSAAAAQAAAVALRLRIERPDLDPEAAAAVLVSGADPLPGVRVVAQGAGALHGTDVPPVVLSPSSVTGTATAQDAGTRVPVRLRDLSGVGGLYRLEVRSTGGAALWTGASVRVPAGGMAAASVDLPPARRGWSGRVVVRDAAGAEVAGAPAGTFPPRGRAGGEIGVPRVSTAGGVTQAVVRVGRLTRTGDRVWSAPVHRVRVRLAPLDGSRPLTVAGLTGLHDWPAGTYRFVLSRRLPTGGSVPPGRYRLVVSGVTAAGRPVSAVSTPFRLR